MADPMTAWRIPYRLFRAFKEQVACGKSTGTAHEHPNEAILYDPCHGLYMRFPNGTNLSKEAIPVKSLGFRLGQLDWMCIAAMSDPCDDPCRQAITDQ